MKTVYILTAAFFVWLGFNFLENRRQNSNEETGRISGVFLRNTPIQAPSPAQALSKPLIHEALAATPQTHVPAQFESEFKAQFPGDWSFERNEEGELFSIHGAEIPQAGKTPESAHQFAKKFTALLGVPSNQISDRDMKTDSTARSITYDFPQSAEGFSVFDGQLRLLARKEDGAIYMINTELKKVESFDPIIRHPVADARKMAEERFKNQNLASLTLQATQPVVWTDASSSELAWFFIAKLGGEAPDRIEVLVSAQSPKMIFERSLTVHSTKFRGEQTH